MSILRRHQQALQQWGLSDNPFYPTPPTNNPQKLLKIFHGRDQELELAIPALYEGRNVMIRGGWGIGKTAFIYTLLNRLGIEVQDIDEQMLIRYLDGSSISTPTDFYRLLLLEITTAMVAAEGLDRAIQDEARAIAGSLMGLTPPNRQSVLEGKVNLTFVSFSAQEKLAAMPDVGPNDNFSAYQLLQVWLDRAQNCFSHMVFAIDNLDKQEARLVQNLLEGSLDLFRSGDRRAFVMTGRGFTDLEEVTLRSLGIFAEDITLKTMEKSDLRQIVLNALNTVRSSPCGDPLPFTNEVLDRITEYAQGNPRQLNTLCDKILRKAAALACDQIDSTAFEAIWRSLQETTTQALTPQIRKLLYVAYRTNGISEDMTNDQLDQLNVLTFSELIPLLKTLEQSELLLRQEDEQGFRFLPSKLFRPDIA